MGQPDRWLLLVLSALSAAVPWSTPAGAQASELPTSRAVEEVRLLMKGVGRVAWSAQGDRLLLPKLAGLVLFIGGLGALASIAVLGPEPDTLEGWRVMRGHQNIPDCAFDSWNGLWQGALTAHNRFLVLEVLQRMDYGDDCFEWRIRPRKPSTLD